MGPLSAASMESYSRAYPLLVKLHMLQVVSLLVCLRGVQRGVSHLLHTREL